MKLKFLILCTFFSAVLPVFGQESVDRFLLNSQMHEREKDYPSALAEIDEAIDIQPGKAGLYLIKARLYRKSGDYNATLENVRLAVSLKPDDEKFLEFCVTELNLSENYAESLNLAERLLSLREKLSTDGRTLAAQKRTILTGYRIRYRTRFMMEDYAGTIDDVIKSRDVVSAYNEGKEIKVDEVFYLITSETAGLLEKTLDKLRDEPEIFYYYGELLRILNETRKGLTINPIWALAMIEPVDVALSADYAALFEKTRTKPEINALFEKFAKDSGVDKRAEIYKRMGKYDLALRDFNELLKSRSDKDQKLSLIVRRGEIFILLNKFDEAVADYEAAKKISLDLNYQSLEYLDKRIAEAKRRKAALNE